MDQWEFYNEFKELCEYYNSKIYENKRITKMYYEKVKNNSLEQFKNMCNMWIKSSKYMMKVSDFGSSDIGNMHRGRLYSKDFMESLYDVGGAV